jgi:rubrerythrin
VTGAGSVAGTALVDGAAPLGCSRHAFLLRSALAIGAAFGAGAVAPRIGAALAAEAPEVTDVSILQFALTLERFEAAFYAEARRQLDLPPPLRRLVDELAGNEDAHVEALAGALEERDVAPAAEPDFVWGDAFRSQGAFLKRAVEFEDVGVGAYNGAAPLIQDRELVAIAGAIVQVEGRHAALVRELRGEPPTVAAFDERFPEGRALSSLSPYIES